MVKPAPQQQLDAMQSPVHTLDQIEKQKRATTPQKDFAFVTGKLTTEVSDLEKTFKVMGIRIRSGSGTRHFLAGNVSQFHQCGHEVAEEEPAMPEFFEKNKTTVAEMEPDLRSSSKVSLLVNLCRSNRFQFQRTVIIPADRRAGGNFDEPAIVLICRLRGKNASATASSDPAMWPRGIPLFKETAAHVVLGIGFFHLLILFLFLGGNGGHSTTGRHRGQLLAAGSDQFPDGLALQLNDLLVDAG
ncbi:conserved hypothetical protein [Culex quinquefasciatus]|uniref:Uncharacterized protein n=1 Tax=Culex quinquefasciatus TaxID=7176 RepID=B0WVC8_CULQU|nr:conserved hypothetical protein [Culex quinquefasciatus]|eukprot:XP_001861350.1 conserved hypothetical protein [Culex quinquefasciatus]